MRSQALFSASTGSDRNPLTRASLSTWEAFLEALPSTLSSRRPRQHLWASPLSTSWTSLAVGRIAGAFLMVSCQGQNTRLIFILSKKQNPTSSVPGCQPTTSRLSTHRWSFTFWLMFYIFVCVFLLSYNLNRLNATHRRRLFIFLVSEAPPALLLVAVLNLLLPPSSSTPPQEVEVAASGSNLAVIPHEDRERRRFPLATMLSVTSVHMCTWRGGTRQRREVGFALWCNTSGPFF